MARTIAIANHKGGVGKTTSVAAIGAALAATGYRTLIVDLDPQANLTESLIKDGEVGRTIYQALKERKDLPVVFRGLCLSVTPSSLQLAGAEVELAGAQNKHTALKSLLSPVADQYDYILIDCPPSLALLTINAFVAADELYIPLTAEALPFKGLMALEQIVGMVQQSLNPNLRLSGIFLTRWEGRKLNKMVEATLRGRYGDRVFATKIRTNIPLAEAPLTKKDIYAYNPKSNGAADYKALTEEIIGRG